MPPVAEQLGVEGGDNQCGPSDPFGLGDQPGSDVGDEVVDVTLHNCVGAIWFVRLLVAGGDGAAGHPRGLEPKSVVVTVEVAVGAVPGIPRAR